MTAVNLLEANWISIQETFELVSRVHTVICRVVAEEKGSSSEGQLD
jgi:hypothetical protein